MTSIRRELSPRDNHNVWDTTEEMGSPSFMVVDRPDWVVLPAQLGGGRVNVIGEHMRACPRCEAASRTYELENGLIAIACAPCNQYFWAKPRS